MKEKIQLSDHFTYSKMFHFTLPIMCTMIVSSIFGSVDDGFFVSNFAGKQAFAAINIVIPASMIVSTLGWMMGTGGSALIGKLLGQGEKEKANELFTFFIYVLVIVGTLVSAIVYLYAEPICKLLGANGTVLEYCIIYGRILICFQPFFLLQNCMQSFLIVAEKPKIQLYIQIAIGITNTVFDFILIYILRMGIVGAALATGAGQLVGGILPLVYFLLHPELPIHFVKTHIDIPSLMKACSNGVADMVNNISMSLVGILLNLQLMKYIGDNGVVAYGVIMYVGFIFVGVFVGYSVGIAPVFSFQYGAKNYDELKSLFKKSIIFLCASSAILTFLAIVTARPLSMIFVNYDKDLLDLTVHATILYSISYLIQHINIFAGSLFSALNCGKVSSIISITRTFILQIATIYIMPWLFGVDGLWLAIVVSEGLTLPISLYFLISRKNEFHYA